MKAVVLAGGAGKGLSRISGGKPKVLLKVCGKAIIEYVLSSIIEGGVNDILIISDKPEDIESFASPFRGLANVKVREQVGKEVVGAILSAKEELRRSSLLVYGDTLVPSEAFKSVIDAFFSFGCPVLMVVPEMDVRLYGAVRVDDRGLITEMIEKPKEHIEGYYAFGGIAVLNNELVNLIESTGSVDAAINRYIEKGGKLVASIWSGWWVDIGYPWDILEAIYYIMSHSKSSVISSNAKIASTAVIEGPVVIDDGAEIDHYAVIKGPAYIGKGVFVGTHSLIRRFTSIEEGVTIGSYTEVTWSYIGEQATVGRGVFLGYSVVGGKAVIESGVVTKLLADPEKVGVKAIREYKKRREYLKIGSFISYGSRVTTLSVLEPGTYV